MLNVKMVLNVYNGGSYWHTDLYSRWGSKEQLSRASRGPRRRSESFWAETSLRYVEKRWMSHCRCRVRTFCNAGLIPEPLVLQTGQHHSQSKTGVELDRLGVVCCGRTWQARSQCREHLDQSVPLPHHQHRNQQGQSQAGAGASDGARCVLARVGALKRRVGEPI